MYRKKLNVLILVIQAFALAVATVACTTVPDTRIPPAPNDGDGDGLPNEWEESRSDWGLDPEIANLIVVPVLRPEVTRDEVTDNLDRLKTVFRELPVITQRGNRGIEVIVRWGNRLDRSFSEGATPFKGYESARSTGMPAGLVGYGHGLLIGSSTGGGGQTSNPDWSGVPNNYASMLHELGHQLGLLHAPLSTGVPSPLYTSLMNYDYSYQFNGDPGAIHYSRGKFSSISLDENALNETLPFAQSDLEFLTKGPYEFETERAAAQSTHVDFNRNDVFGESGVVADVNDGSGLLIGDIWKEEGYAEVTGDVALAALGDSLVAFYTRLPAGVRDRLSSRGASRETPGYLDYLVIRDKEIVFQGNLSGSIPTLAGSPHAMTVGDGIVLGYPATGNLMVVQALKLLPSGRLTGPASLIPVGEEVHISIADLKSASLSYAMLWDESTKNIEMRKLTVSDRGIAIGSPFVLERQTGSTPAERTPMRSVIPPAATLNSKTGRLVLLTAEHTGSQSYRMRSWALGRHGDERWVALNAKWLWEGAMTEDRPVILFDDRPSAGDFGRFLIYFRSKPGDDGSNVRMQFIRVMPPHRTGGFPESPYRYRQRGVGNAWTVTPNPPAVAPYLDDFAIMWRQHPQSPDPVANNQGQIAFKASGEYHQNMTDFDDVNHIATRGMQESLAAVRP